MACSKCNGFCCKEYVPLISSADARRIVHNLPPQPSPETYLVLYEKEFGEGNYPVIHLNGTDEYILGLKYEEDHCYFLKESGLCEIHAFKPLVCALYPYRIKEPICPEKWVVDVARMRPLLKQYRAEKRAYQEEVAAWNTHSAEKDFTAFLRFLQCV